MDYYWSSLRQLLRSSHCVNYNLQDSHHNPTRTTRQDREGVKGFKGGQLRKIRAVCLGLSPRQGGDQGFYRLCLPCLSAFVGGAGEARRSCPTIQRSAR